jgi:hypothetical protein
MTIPKLEPITETVRQLNPDIWPEVFDWRVQLDMAMHGLGSELKVLADAIEDSDKVPYLMEVRNQAMLNSHLARLMLLCSVLREFSKPKAMQAAE